MNIDQQDALKSLRNAIKHDQLDLCYEILRELVPDLDHDIVINIIVKQAQQFLVTLSQKHPENERFNTAIGALSAVNSLNSLDQAGKVIDPILDEYWNWPGVSSVRNAFKGISKPQQYFDHSGDDAKTFVSILAKLLMANVTVIYWDDNPEFSKTFFGDDIRKAVFMVAKQHSNPRNIELRQMQWSSLVDDFEAAFDAK